MFFHIIIIIAVIIISGSIRPLTSDELGVGVLVDLGQVDDGACLLGVAQCAEALIHVAGGRAHRGDHGRLGVAAQALLQQPAGQRSTVRTLARVGKI